MQNEDKSLEKEFGELRETLRTLRGENGCPWDREQSLDDIISYLIDESYELLQAEKTGDWDDVEEELGDVVFLVIFIHEFLLEKRKTTLAEIVSRVHRKIVSRHPHVFGSSNAANSAESTAEWERIKRDEKKTKHKSGALEPPPKNLPPLRRAVVIQKNAAGTGFDWPDHRGVVDKLREETDELEAAIDGGNRNMVKEELGDILFTVVNLARRMDIDPENALETTMAKFLKRFREMERKASERGVTLDTMTLDDMEELWQQSKD